jgi:hypothetical protein
MGISFAQLIKHLNPRNNWTGFENCTYDPRLLTVTEAVGSLTAWSIGRETFRDHLNRVGLEGLPDAPRIQEYAEDFRIGPVYLIAFTLETFARIWPANWAGRTGTDLVIWDGHHRMSALAVRESRAIKDDHPVIVFVGS